MQNTAHLTVAHREELAGQIAQTKPGQAYWADTGPFGAVCKECAHYGYHRRFYNRRGDIVKTTFRPGACGKFHDLTGKHGPDFSGATPACKYFERRN
jgi:hypothetical protein